MLHHHFHFSQSLSQTIEQAGTLRNFEQGEHLSRQNDHLDSVGFLLSGLVSVWINTPDDRQLLMSIIGPGYMLGGLPLIDKQSRIYTVIALESAQVLRVPKKAMETLLKENFEFSQFLNKTLASRFRKIAHILYRERYSSRKQRLADILLEIFGECRSNELPITQEQLSHMTDCSRPMLIDELKKLEKGQAIKRQYGKIQIIDPTQLENIAGMNTL